ncbi:hypothetical protein [Pseudonocardia thermophila]|uniref:hypothetical protein n=1 Tax=Pseudonocardia thermophila TaxID=1848 RepID=UPI00190EDF7B|nr:hypothetical protein [Pseudonocardia thermophila]
MSRRRCAPRGPDGALRGTPLIDPAEAVEHGVGIVLAETSAAERVAELATGAHV